jgi:hypothetical protein
VNGVDTAGDRRVREAASTLELLQRILRELPGLVSDRVELLSLELLRAGQALAQIVALLVAVAILGVTAWIAAWAAVALALVERTGLHWGWALAAVLTVNAVAAWIAVARVRSLFPRLTLPATRRQLTLRDDTFRPRVHPAADLGITSHDTNTRRTAT